MKYIMDLVRNMKIQQKLIIIYILGGFIPMMLISIYLTSGMKKILLEQTKTSERIELTAISERINESIKSITKISEKFYFDEGIEKIAFTQFNNLYEIVEAYMDDTTVIDFMKSNNDIQGIRIYINNPTIVDNARYSKITDEITNEEWYKKAILADGKPIWLYKYDKTKKQNYLCLVRVLKTNKNKMVGVLTINVLNDSLKSYINTKKYESVIVLNDDTLITSSLNGPNEKKLLELYHKYNSGVGSDRVVYNKEDCLFTVQHINLEKTDSRLSIISLQPYKDILEQVNEKSRESFFIIIFCVLLSFIFIALFSNSFSIRVKHFHKQMHKAAMGDFDIAQRIEGRDEIGELYDDLHIMIDSIKKLLEEVYEEKIQKEKLNSKQKDVEFKMLASQINPHFLYNTLETIRMKARFNEQYEIENLVKMLAKIMRRNIEVTDQLVILRSEVTLVEYYLKIQTYRFGDRISFHIENRCNMSQYYILPLIIQPIVENAFVHGLEGKQGKGELRIYIEEKDNLEIRVEDNGIGIPNEKLKVIKLALTQEEEMDKSHIGLTNVNQRIKLFYGREYGVTIESTQGEGTIVTMLLPKRRV